MLFSICYFWFSSPLAAFTIPLFIIFINLANYLCSIAMMLRWVVGRVYSLLLLVHLRQINIFKKEKKYNIKMVIEDERD